MCPAESWPSSSPPAPASTPQSTAITINNQMRGQKWRKKFLPRVADDHVTLATLSGCWLHKGPIEKLIWSIERETIEKKDEGLAKLLASLKKLRETELRGKRWHRRLLESDYYERATKNWRPWKNNSLPCSERFPLWRPRLHSDIRWCDWWLYWWGIRSPVVVNQSITIDKPVSEAGQRKSRRTTFDGWTEESESKAPIFCKS